MIGSFIFNDKNSEDLKLVCKSVKRPLLPAAKPKRVEVKGSSGIYDFDGLEYTTRPLSMKIQYIGDDYTELRSRARDIAAWLYTDGAWKKLIINDEPDKYYLAKVTDEVDLESAYESGTADVSFDCQPFAYSVNKNTFNFTGGSYTFNNKGSRRIDCFSPYGSEFVITLSGTFSSTKLSMNGKTLGFSQSTNGTLVIDNIAMTAMLNGSNSFDSLTDDVDSFLSILPGANTLTVSGFTGTITVEFIQLWM